MTEIVLKNKHQITRVISIFDRVDEYYRYLKQSEPTLNENHLLYQEYSTYINYVNSLLRGMNPNYSYILINCFYGYRKDSYKWWKTHYSKSSFYRLKQNAINTFLERYQPWNELRNY